MSWTAHPARERLGPAAMSVAFIALLAIAATSLGGHVGWGVLSALVLIATLNRFFFPSTFRIDDEGITAQYPLRRLTVRWADAQRIVTDDKGAYLSTRSRRSWLDAYRGMHVLFGGDRDAVIGAIRERMT